MKSVRTQNIYHDRRFHLGPTFRVICLLWLEEALLGSIHSLSINDLYLCRTYLDIINSVFSKVVMILSLAQTML